MTHLTEVHLENIRCHAEVDVVPEESEWVVLAGGNGSGKTSIMEGIYCAARGRSFRSPSVGEVIRGGQDSARILIRARDGTAHVLGMELQTRQRRVHLDGAAADLTAIAEAVPVEYLGGETTRLVQGTPATRRRFMDWALFHVEPQFLPAWRDWYRAHRQRNALLKAQADRAELAPWTEAVIRYGEVVSALRGDLVRKLRQGFEHMDKPRALVGLQPAFRRGWRGTSLRAALEASAGREMHAGRAVAGPQLDDWVLEGDLSGTTSLSRGQAKLASLMLFRCQADIMRGKSRRPVLLIDDVAADLDPAALRSVIGLWAGLGLQVWLSVLADDIGLELPGRAARFHVEHGKLERRE